MKFTEKSIVGSRIEFLASSTFLAVSHTFDADTKSGALVEITDGTGEKLKGICLYDVVVDKDPNGSVVVSGVINTAKLPTKPTSSDTMYPTLIFV